MYAIDFASVELLETPTLSDDRYVLHSHGGASGTQHIGHAVQRVTGGGQSVSVRTWRSSMGRLRVELSGADVAQWVARNIPRGLIAQLKIGFEGMTFDQFESVGMYQYQNLTGSRNSWLMDFNDVIGALQSANGIYLSSQFMKQAGQQAIHTGLGSPTFSVSSAANFLRDSGTSSRGLMLVSPHEGADPYYAKFTSASASSPITVLEQNVIGTTYSDVTPGDTLTAMAYVSGHLPDVIAQLLFGGIGGAPTMPDAWNLGLNFSAETVNTTDFNEWRSRWLLYPQFDADFLTAEPLENPYRGIESFMSAFGSWLVMREGRLSWRFLQRFVPVGDGFELPVKIDRTITDQDIAGEEVYNLFHPEAPVEYFQVQFANSTFSPTAEQ